MMKTIIAIFAVVLVGLPIACTSEPTAQDFVPTPMADFDTLSEWYSSDTVVDNIRKSYQSIDQQPPQVGHFAQACTLSRKVRFAEMISNEEIRNRTRGEEYSTAYNTSIAWLLAGGTPDEQKEWCDNMVALYNFDPWFGNKIEW